MAQARINVGPLDARARQVAGALAVVGGLTALDGFFQALGFLTWIVCAAMMYVGIILAMGGFKDGTAQGLLGPVGGDLRRGRRLPDRTDTAVSDQRVAGGEHGSRIHLGRRSG